MQKDKLKIAARRLARMQYLINKRSFALPKGQFRATFKFSATELGKTVRPSDEQIEKLGLKRATERLTIDDFYTTVSVLGTGEPTPENLMVLRNQTLSNLLIQKTVNPAIIPTSDLNLEEEVSNELNRRAD